MTNRTDSLMNLLKPSLLSTALGLVLIVNMPAYADSNYGPIVPGETLSKIVSENYLTSQYSSTVIMNEIFRLNPESFINNNIGLLKQGVELVLPDDNTIRLSSGEQVVTVSTPRPIAQVQSRPRLVTVQESLRLVRKERDDLKLSLTQSKTELSSLKAQLDTVQTRLNSLSDKATSASLPSVNNDAAMSSLESNLNNVRSEREALKVELESALSVRTGLEAQLKTANDALAVSKQSLNEVSGSLSALKQGSSQQSAAAIAAQLTKTSLEKSNALIVEKDKQIEVLKVSVKGLEKQLAEAPVAAPVVKAESVSAETTKVIADLNQQILVYQEEVKELQSQNDQLVNELLESPESLAGLDSGMTVEPLIDEGMLAVDGEASSINNDNNHFLSKHISLPRWSALLGLLLLGFTAFMALVGRKNKDVPALVETADNDVVFKSGRLNARDEDVEALRVPPRRDPSRVAILDPTMAAKQATEVVSHESVSTSELSNNNDADLKLAMAEAYIELTDSQAANELLHEVLLEGTSQQKTSAELLMSRLAS